MDAATFLAAAIWQYPAIKRWDALERILREIENRAPDAVADVAQVYGMEDDTGPTHDDDRGGRA